MIRANYYKEDIQRVIWTLLEDLAGDTFPYNKCEIKFNYPDFDVTRRLEKPVVYVQAPLNVEKSYHFGGETGLGWSMIIGIWADRTSGHEPIVNAFVSSAMNFFLNPQTLNQRAFTIKLGTTTYTDTTLISMGVYIEDVEDSGDIVTEEIHDIRKEIKLYLRS